MIETSGAHPLDALPDEVVRIVDVKTPASGESHRMRWELLAELRPRDAAKFVVADEGDYRWACEVIREHDLGGRTEVLLSPVHGRLDPKDLVAWMLRDRLPAQAQPAAAQVRLGSGGPRRIALKNRHLLAKRQDPG